MSKICIAILNDDVSTERITTAIQPLLKRYNLAVSYKLTYDEPLLEKYRNKAYKMFSFADNVYYDNCEMFLLPDNCFFNGQKNSIPFQARMQLLEEIFERVLDFTPKIEVFIGDSGTRYDEFDRAHCKLYNFLDVSVMLNTEVPPDLHFVIER